MCKRANQFIAVRHHLFNIIRYLRGAPKKTNTRFTSALKRKEFLARTAVPRLFPDKWEKVSFYLFFAIN